MSGGRRRTGGLPRWPWGSRSRDAGGSRSRDAEGSRSRGARGTRFRGAAGTRFRAARARGVWLRTLSGKFSLFLVATCCVVALAIGVLVHVLVSRQVVDNARTEALRRLDSAARSYVAGEPLPGDAAVDPPQLPRPLRERALHGARGTQLGEFEEVPTMWAAVGADDKVLAARFDYRPSARTLDGLDRAIVISAGAAITGTLLAGLFAVSRVTRRLHHTAAVADRINEGDLDARVADPESTRDARYQDEVAAVSRALDAMAATLQRKLHSEQRFTADVAHELRTPLAGLQASADLLPPGRPTELVRDRVQALRRLTEDLLEISRLDSDTERADLAAHDLGELARQTVRASGLEVEVVVVHDQCVVTDRRRLERVLGNLLANAHRHGRPPVSLTVDGLVLTVRDHGDGYPDSLLTEGPQRFRTEPRRSGGGKGHGLGLTIALGQARIIQADLSFANAPDGGGAVTTLTLPAACALPDPGPL